MTPHESADRVLELRLLRYALAAGVAVACQVPAYGEVIFTPSNAVITGPAKITIDLDNDGNTDITVFLRQCATFSGYGGFVACASAKGGRRFDGIAIGSYEQARALVEGARIGPRHRFLFSAIMGTALRYVGSWGFVKHRFLGIKFLINGETHFGWVGFRSVDGVSQFTVSLAGWAYETEPNKTIVAGDVGTSSPVVHPTSLEILSFGHNAIEQRRKRIAQ